MASIPTADKASVPRDALGPHDGKAADNGFDSDEAACPAWLSPTSGTGEIDFRVSVHHGGKGPLNQ